MKLDSFVAGLREAVRTQQVSLVRELVAEAVAGPPLAREAGCPHTSQVLVSEPGLLVLHVVVDPDYVTAPHEHRTWSVVGVHEGAEDNVFYRRIPGQTRIEQTGGTTLDERDVLVLGESGIHRIASPRTRPLMALHVYGANIFANERSAWDPETFQEEPFAFERHAGGPQVR